MPVKLKITKKAEPISNEPVVIHSGEQAAEKSAPVPTRTKKGCFFCQNKKEPTFEDSVTLRRFLSDRSRILPKLRTGACSKHQHHLTRQIKYARHLALLPFVPSV